MPNGLRNRTNTTELNTSSKEPRKSSRDPLPPLSYKRKDPPFTTLNPSFRFLNTSFNNPEKTTSRENPGTPSSNCWDKFLLLLQSRPTVVPSKESSNYVTNYSTKSLNPEISKELIMKTGLLTTMSTEKMKPTN